MRLIDADELNKTLGIDSDSCSTCSWGYRGRCSRGCDFEDACCAIEDAPAIDPVKRGKWKKTYLDHDGIGERPCIFYCSVCNQCIAYPVNYCPSCGAYMRGEENE